MTDTVAILVGGGPAPDIYGMISAADDQLSLREQKCGIQDSRATVSDRHGLGLRQRMPRSVTR